MGQIKRLINKAGHPTSLVSIVSIESGKTLSITFPVMGSRRGWREMEFPAMFGHAEIAQRVISCMEFDLSMAEE